MFLGPKVDPVAYNKLMHRDGAGFFPVAARRSKPTKPLTEDEKRTGRSSSPSRSCSATARPRLTRRSAASTPTSAATSSKDRDIERFFLFLRHRPALADLAPRQVARGPVGPGDSSACRTTRRSRSWNRGSDSLMQGRPRSSTASRSSRSTATAVDKQLDEDSRRCSSTEGTPLTILARELDRLLADQINDGDAERGALPRVLGPARDGRAQEHGPGAPRFVQVRRSALPRQAVRQRPRRGDDHRRRWHARRSHAHWPALDRLARDRRRGSWS